MPCRRASWEASVLSPDSSPLELPDVAEFSGSWGRMQAGARGDSERTLGYPGAVVESMGPGSTEQRMDRAQLPICWLPAAFQERARTFLFL